MGEDAVVVALRGRCARSREAAFEDINQSAAADATLEVRATSTQREASDNEVLGL